MASWNSGDRDATDGVASRHIPALAVAGVGLLLLYAVVMLYGITRGRIFGVEWLVAMALLICCARAVLADYSRLVRFVCFLVFAAIMPGAVVLVAAYQRSGVLVSHAFVLFALCVAGWKLLEPVVEQCTGCTTAMAPRPRRHLAVLPRFPFIRVYEKVAPAGLAYSGDALLTLIVVGTALFSLAEFLRLNRGLTGILSPLPFALLFYLIAGGLLSLSKLVQRLRETPGTVRLESGFIRRWAGVMLTVLAVCGALAMVLPKQPVIGSGRWVVSQADERTRGFRPHPADWQPRAHPTPDGRPTSRMPFGGRGDQPAGGGTGTPGETRGVPTGDGGPADAAATLLRDAATAFEQDAQQTGNTGGSAGEAQSAPPGPPKPGDGQSAGSGGGRSGQGESGQSGGGTGGGRSNTAGSGTADGMASPSGASSHPDERGGATPMEELRQALRGRPDRQIKLAAVLLIALAMLAGLVLLAVILVRRHVWYLLVNLWRLVSEWAGARLCRWLGPWRECARLRRREARLQQLMAGLHPFDDPFARAAHTGDLPAALFTAFQAHAWLLGYERKPAETAFAFATRLADLSGLEGKAIWEITMGCVRTEFSPTPLSAVDLQQLNDAYARLTAAILARLPAETLPERREAYRRLLAERQLDREAAASPPEPHPA